MIINYLSVRLVRNLLACALSFSFALSGPALHAARTVETETFSLKPQSVPPAGEQGTIPGADAGQKGQPGIAPRISYDISLLPQAVQKTRAALIAAARSGNLAALNSVISANGQPPVVAFDEIDDPVGHLRELSGDEEGQEILAILLEMLEAGYARVDAETEAEIYVWPYFAYVPLDTLTPEQRVELFTLVTAGDYEGMKAFGAYNFFRVGISPDGVWQFFLTAD
uniref:hypothetical protein n=1 Tax=Pararhizobium sp. IMCC3301 TaxID=3067904 RepID=UPI002740EE2F|nr:hypothetical protein [Pararhizobium sp. IMCC3301]